MQWMHGHEVTCPVDGRGRDVVAATQYDVTIPRRCGGQFRPELTGGVWIADQYGAVSAHQSDRHSHMFGCRPIEFTQVLNIDDPEYHSKKSAPWPADAPGEIEIRLSGHAAPRQRTDEHFRAVMVSAPDEVVAAGHIHSVRVAKPGPIQGDTARTDKCNSICLRDILHTLGQKVMDCRRSHQALEILRGLKVQIGGF